MNTDQKPIAQKRGFRPRSVSTRLTFLITAVTLSALTGCLGVENFHFKVSQHPDDSVTVRIGGLVTDQIIENWESQQFDSNSALLFLRQVTAAAPVRIIEQGTLPWPGDKIWIAAIADNQQASFQLALKTVYEDISRLSLAIFVESTTVGTRGPKVVWTVVDRNFVGERAVHLNIEPAVQPIEIRPDGAKLVDTKNRDTFVPFGFNYFFIDDVDGVETFHDREQLTREFAYARTILKANTLRIHIDYFRLMDTPTTPNMQYFNYLKMLISVAEETGMYLDFTGLACYKIDRIPEWYHALDEEAHWEMQAAFWATVARMGAGSNAILFYDLVNEPVVATGAYNPDYPWIVDSSYGGHYFVQRIALDLNGRTRKEIAKVWIDRMVTTIRQHDPRTPISIGVIPFALKNENAQPLFYDPLVAENLDLVCIHAYPTTDAAENEVKAQRISKYEIGKPILIEEIYNHNSGQPLMVDFIEDSLVAGVDGWISFYHGETIEELYEDGSISTWFQIPVLEYYRDEGEYLIKRAK
ncbi:MAG: cellulase family glycosylhydrolase [Pirellulaceae bacterium]|nr:cellulase family glycosylhydrolase [Pirellulaceae bacterium]